MAEDIFSSEVLSFEGGTKELNPVALYEKVKGLDYQKLSAQEMCGVIDSWLSVPRYVYAPARLARERETPEFDSFIALVDLDNAHRALSTLIARAMEDPALNDDPQRNERVQEFFKAADVCMAYARMIPARFPINAVFSFYSFTSPKVIQRVSQSSPSQARRDARLIDKSLSYLRLVRIRLERISAGGQKKVRKRRRTKVPAKTELMVLSKSRRRCCLCLAFENDLTYKKGHIAHIDHDSGNNAQSNLVFLCLQHHNDYDSTPSQSKGITPGEVRQYKADLMTALRSGGAERGRKPNRSGTEQPKVVFDVMRCTLTFDAPWMILELSTYAKPSGTRVFTFPFHDCAGSFVLPSTVKPTPLKDMYLCAGRDWSPSWHSSARGVDFALKKPGETFIGASALVRLSQSKLLSFYGKMVKVSISLRAVGTSEPIQIECDAEVRIRRE